MQRLLRSVVWIGRSTASDRRRIMFSSRVQRPAFIMPRATGIPIE
jgi:hypothetical protein